jgi:hypothetical protein
MKFVAAALIAGMLSAAPAAAKPKSGKSAHAPGRSAPVHLRSGQPQYPSPPTYQGWNDWDGWVPPPLRAGGVG